jgi:outer membrane usher protein
MTLTNALGRQVLTTLPFYASSSLLAPGLQTFAAQAGAVRRNWGVRSNDYGQTAASASYRRGLSPVMTVEATAEGTAGTVMAGSGAVFNVGNRAVLNVAAAGSTGPVGTGGLVSAGVQRVGRVFSFNASATAANARFRDIAAVMGDLFPRLQLSASTGLSLGRYGSVGLAYAQQRRDAAASSTPLLGVAMESQPAQSARLVSASYSVQLRGMSINATGFRDLDAAGVSGVMIGLTLPLGTRDSVGASLNSSAGRSTAQVQAQQSAVTIGDWGYQAYATSGSAGHQFMQLENKTPWALLSAGVDRLDGQTALALKASGSLSLVDQRLFPSNTISDSFAVVDTNGLAGVRVLHENRDAGVTNASGHLLPGLRAFEVNHLALDPTYIPQDTTLHDAEREVRPQDRSGVVVRFPVKISRGALLRLVDGAGTPVPVGSAATLRSTGEAVPVGYDGETYVEGLAPHNEVVVELANGKRCSVIFPYQPVPGEIPAIGPLTCQEQKP